jgi:hypothetical protein
MKMKKRRVKNRKGESKVDYKKKRNETQIKQREVSRMINGVRENKIKRSCFIRLV